MHGDSLSSFPLAKAQMTLAAFNVAPDSPPARLPHGNGKAPMMMSDPISGAGNTHEATAFTGRVIQALEQTGAEALFFQMAFENDEIQLQVLDAVNRKTDIIMGITRTVREKENAFGLPKEFFSLSHLCLIQWQVLHPQDNLDTRPLWQISRQGIWNHFTLDPGEIDSKPGAFLSFILANPNIAHSYQLLPVPMTDGKDIPPEPAILPSTFFPYRNVTPLPGIPLWQVIDNPAHMLLYLTRHTRKELFPMRVNPETGTSFSLGRDISFYFQKPEALPPGYMEEICNMVEAGGSVATQWVRYNLERAFLIAYAMENGVIVGNSSLKRPRKPFIERINKISGMDFTHFLERGYTSVRPEYRALGVGAKLLEGLTARAGDHKIFSIISEENTATQKIAIRNNTRKVVTYYSEQMGKKAGIWMPESMIDTM